MQFHTVERLDRHNEVVCEYTDLRGQRKILRREYIANAVSSIDHVEYFKRSMKRDIAHELGEQAVTLQEEQDMVYGGGGAGGTGGSGCGGYAGYTTLYDNAVSYGINTWATTDAAATFSVQYATAPWNEVVYREIEIEFPLGKRTLTLKKAPTDGKISVTLEDIGEAIKNHADQFRFSIITKKAERRAEDLLQQMISDIDFRNYKKNGYFTVQQGNKLFRIYKDKQKWVDMWEKDPLEGIYRPKNRLCTHTETRELPDADEALSKLLLARSGRLLDHSNLHSIMNTRGLEMSELKDESELILV